MTHSAARVTTSTDLTPRLRRVQFHVPDLARLALPGDPDEAVGIYFPLPGETATPEMECRNGVWGYHDPESAPEARNYSVRAIDHATGTMTVDFVVHSHGPATAWAQRAEPGHQVVMAHARGWYRPPPTRYRLPSSSTTWTTSLTTRISCWFPVAATGSDQVCWRRRCGT